MPVIARTRRHPRLGIAPVLLAIAAGLVATAAATPPAAARQAAGPAYVKYYIVQPAFGGRPEDLAEIAVRFLGSAARGAEIFDLNEGRPQPAGGELTTPAVIDPGWALVLPWDAVGPGVRYGLLPATAPAPPARALSQRRTRALAIAAALALIVLLLLLLRIRRMVRPAAGGPPPDGGTGLAPAVPAEWRSEW